MQGAIGNRELHAGKYEPAVAHLQQALKNGPANTILYTDLAEALIKLDRKSDAVAVLEKATEADPFNATLRKTLVVQLIQIKDYVKAKSEMENYVKRFPQDTFMRQMLARAQAAGRAQ